MSYPSLPSWSLLATREEVLSSSPKYLHTRNPRRIVSEAREVENPKGEPSLSQLGRKAGNNWRAWKIRACSFRIHKQAVYVKILGGIIIKGNTVTNFIGPGDGRRGPRSDPHHAPRRVPHHATSKRREIQISRNLHYLPWYILYFLCHLDR